jgi:hypothetical protein
MLLFLSTDSHATPLEQARQGPLGTLLQQRVVLQAYSANGPATPATRTFRVLLE